MLMLFSSAGLTVFLRSPVESVSMLASLPLFALALRGHSRPAMFFALASFLLPLVRYAGDFSLADLLSVGSLNALTLAALTIATVRGAPITAASWWWLLPPAVLGILAAMPSPVATIALGTALALIAIAAVCATRFALAFVPLSFALASSYLEQWWTYGAYAGSNFVALSAAIAAGIGLAFLLRAGLALKPRRSATSK